MKAPSYRSPTPGTGKPHECPVCGKRLADRRSLKQHAAAAHREGVSPQRADVEGVGTSDRLEMR